MSAIRWAMFREVAIVAMAFVALVFALHMCVGCSPRAAGATAAESAYTADLLRCVDEARTLAESRKCREGVDAKWGVAQTVRKDGGT